MERLGISQGKNRGRRRKRKNSQKRVKGRNRAQSNKGQKVQLFWEIPLWEDLARPSGDDWTDVHSFCGRSKKKWKGDAGPERTPWIQMDKLQDGIENAALA